MDFAPLALPIVEDTLRRIPSKGWAEMIRAVICLFLTSIRGRQYHPYHNVEYEQHRTVAGPFYFK